MKITKTEIHLSDFMYLAGSVNRDKKLRFTLSIIFYCEEGDPLGLTMAGCIAYINHKDRLTWHPPAMKNRGIISQQIRMFKRLHDLVVTHLASTKYAKQLTRNALAYFEKTPGEVDENLLNEPDEIVKEL
jgi:hypothetical protein